MAKFINPEVIAFVKNYFPHFDFAKDRSRKELSSVIKVCDKKRHLEKETRRIQENQKKGIIPGASVICRGEKQTVAKISKSGHIILVGVKGAFHPLSIQRVE